MDFKKAKTLLNMGSSQRKRLLRQKNIHISAGPMKATVPAAAAAAAAASPGGNTRKRSNPGRRQQPGIQPVCRSVHDVLLCCVPSQMVCSFLLLRAHLPRSSTTFKQASQSPPPTPRFLHALSKPSYMPADDSLEAGASQKDQRQEQRQEQGRKQREADALAQQERIKELKQKKERRQSLAAATAAPLLTHGVQTDADAQPLFPEQKAGSQVTTPSSPVCR